MIARLAVTIVFSLSLVGAGSARLARAQAGGSAEIDRAVMDGIRGGVYPGAVVVVGRHDTILHARGYGHFTWSASSQVPNPDSSLFDLASLTKVVATTPAVMKLLETGELELDRLVRDYLADFVGAGKEAVAVRHLLSHTSGLRAWLDLSQETSDATAARRRVMEEPLLWPHGSRVEYSDLNAMLLGWIVEAISGVPLDRFVEDNVLRSLGMRDTRFKPARSLWRRIVPNGLWQGTAVAGTVHDQNAARLGGVAGHAGLFSTGADLARYARVWLNAGRNAACTQVFRSGTVALFTRRAAENRTLGWELRDTTTAGSAGIRLSPSAFGHTGFTGTSIWIDPVQDLFVIILTNRVYAPRVGRSITRIREIRGKVADAAAAFAAVAPRANRKPVGSSC